MVEITIQHANDEIISIEMKGHADSNVKGHDLVCAALSAIITGGASSIKEIKNFDVKLKEGNSHIISKNIISDYDKIVLKTIVTELECVAISNKKYVKIIKK